MQNIEQIFQELIELEPSLKEKEGRVKEIISLMIASNPKVQISEDFKKKLRKKVLEEMQKNTYASSSKLSTFFKYLTPFIAGGAVVYTALQFTLLPHLMPSKDINTQPVISPKQERAFGDLKSLGLGVQNGQVQTNKMTASTQIGEASVVNMPAQPTQDKSLKEEKIQMQQPITSQDKQFAQNNSFVDEVSSSDIAPNQGGRVKTSSTVTSAQDAGTVSSDAPSVGEDMQDIPSIMPIPYSSTTTTIAPSEPYAGVSTPGYFPDEPYIPTLFVYDTLNIQLPEYAKKMNVYKLEKSQMPISSVADISGNGIIDFSKLKDIKIEYLSLYEDTKEGYNITYDVANSSINFSTRYNEFTVQNERNIGSQTNKKLSQESIIKIADEFLNKFKIQVSNYSAAQIQADLGVMPMYEQKIGAEPMPWYSETVSLVYPQKISGYDVYDMGGYPVGLFVSVSQSKQKVISAGPIEKQHFSESLYDTETSVDKIKEEIQKKNQNYYDPSQKVKTVSIPLGIGKIVYVKIYASWPDDKGMYGIYYVPAVKFEIEKKIEGYYGDSVIIPLIKDFFEENLYGYPMPMGVEGSSNEGFMGEIHPDVQ